MLFSGALPIPRYSYSNKSDVTILSGVRCEGGESNLLECNVNFTRGEQMNDFRVGVRCDGM